MEQGRFAIGLLTSIRKRCGDFWWYAALIFIASRFGDLFNMFINLWLVPKFVPAEELGAVQPLSTFATALAMPVTICGLVFMKQANMLAAGDRRGQLKTMLRSVFLVTAVLLAVMVVLAYITMPYVFTRVRVANGSLGFLIIATGFLGTASPIYVNALRALKRFKAMSVMHALAAPIRLVVLLVAMPFRAIAGYFAAQSSMSLWQILLSVFSLRRELGAEVKSEPFWTSENVRVMLRYGFFVFLYALPVLASFTEEFVIRGSLSSVDSAAYYMIVRFAEISIYVSAALLTVLFPYVSESANKDEGRAYRLIYRSAMVSIGFGLSCAALFYFAGGWLLSILPNGGDYAPYAPQMALLTVSYTLGAATNCSVVGYLAAERFRFLWWWVPSHLVYAGLLLIFIRYASLTNILVAMFILQLIKLACVFLPFNHSAYAPATE